MNTQEIIQSQLNTVIASLTRARNKIADMEPDDAQEIFQQISLAAFYLEDIQYNWTSLVNNHAVQRPLTTQDREAA